MFYNPKYFAADDKEYIPKVGDVMYAVIGNFFNSLPYFGKVKITKVEENRIEFNKIAGSIGRKESSFSINIKASDNEDDIDCHYLHNPNMWGGFHDFFLVKDINEEFFNNRFKGLIKKTISDPKTFSWKEYVRGYVGPFTEEELEFKQKEAEENWKFVLAFNEFMGVGEEYTSIEERYKNSNLPPTDITERLMDAYYNNKKSN